MRIFARLFAGVVVSLLAIATSAPAWGQSTDAFHGIQVLPIVVDTASFSQRITFRNPYTGVRTLSPTYYPAQGTAQANTAPGALSCPSFVVPPGSQATFTSLRLLCPGLVAGSAFGTLIIRGTGSYVFSAFSRVSNPAGNGFSVEAFPAHTFTSAITSITGLRRLAATAGSPAFQSNCFIGNLAQLGPTQAPVTTEVLVSLRTGNDTLIGQTVVPVASGQIVRLLDVFAAVGSAGGDFDDASATFDVVGDEDPGILSFCTVQDNTSFGADFRIGKQEQGFGFLTGWQDNALIRDGLVSGDFQFTGEAAPRKFVIPAGASGNVHLLYFRHPDVIGCTLWRAADTTLAQPAYGLEMRLLGRASGATQWSVLAGGNDITGFADLYLGDKNDKGNGANSHYLLEVESNGQNEGVERAYKIRCRSGSGHTLGEMVRTGAPVAF